MTSARSAYVFALAGKADADNIIPVIWEVSRDGTPCHVVVADASVYESLRRAWWLSERPSVRVTACFTHDGQPTFSERLQRVRWNRLSTRRFLRRTNACLVCVQWREGVAHDDAVAPIGDVHGIEERELARRQQGAELRALRERDAGGQVDADAPGLPRPPGGGCHRTTGSR